MKQEVPKIMRDAQRVRLSVREAVLRMPRLHKYDTGAEINASARAVVIAVNDMWRARASARKLRLAKVLCRRVDSLIFDLQLAMGMNAFRGFNEFEAIIRIVEEVGAQSGGFRRGLEKKSQNAAVAKPPQQRAQTLSAQNAQHIGANP